ncbi:MAG: hypothetical protein VKL41_04800 [Snowella sp.]|nr:hypothetical protein [Snowella sp.]
MGTEQEFFDELKRRVDILHLSPQRDNEASRHDLLIYPLLTSPFGLGWDAKDLVSQSTIKVPREVSSSHIFRNGEPKIRKPDILISPVNLRKNIAVIEEKEFQSSIEKLNNYRLQVAEYQALYECTWGVISDGEKWLLKKNFETFHQFDSLDELRLGMIDLRNCIGKEQVTERLIYHGTCDLVVVVPLFELTQNILSLQSDLTQLDFYFKIPVIVVGVELGIPTLGGTGFEEFTSLNKALQKYPDLAPNKNTKRFTWAIKEVKGEKINRLRFETWAAYDLYST